MAMERPSSEATPRELPDELVDRIAALRCSAGGFREWCASWRGVSRRFANLRWFEEHARGGSPVAVVPSPEYPSVQLGISRAPPATESASRRPKDDADVLRDDPIVLVLPGTHCENLRVTRTCAVVGWGARDDVVVEGTGWEPALAFAGLGASDACARRALGDRSDRPSTVASSSAAADALTRDVRDTGERARVTNLTLRCRNDMQAYAVVVVSGEPTLESCALRGGALVLGARTRPKMLGCVVSRSRGAGVKVTDHARVDARRCRVERNGGNGLLVERGGLARLTASSVRWNGAEAVLHTPDTPGVALVGEENDVPPARVELAAAASGGDGVERAVVSARCNWRRLREGAETETHLHGEAPDESWLRANEWVDAVGYDG